MKELGTPSLFWNEDTIYALGLYKLVGRTLGVWPLNCQDIGSNIRFIVVIILQLIMNYNLIQEFVNGCVSIFHAVDFIGVLGTTSVSLLKIVVLRIHKEKMYLIVESAVHDWAIFRDEKSREIMRRHAFIGRFVLLFQLTSSYASCVIIFLSVPPTFRQTAKNYLNESNLTLFRNIPLGSGCSVSHMSMFFYITFYCFQLIQLICLCTCSMGCDSLFFGFAMHLCAQFELLKINITKLKQNCLQGNVQKELAVLIDRHNHLIELIDLIEGIFHVVILVQLASSITHLSLLGIEILFGLRDGNYMTLVYSSSTISDLLLQIYMFSYAGEYLSSQSMKIRDAAYNCSWYNFSSNITKDVMFIIVRCNRPFYLTAGKIYRMNIESFTTLVKTMASFYSVLKLTIIG